MRYLFMETYNGDTDVVEFETKKEAIEYGDMIWNGNCDKDKKNCQSCCIIESINPDQEAIDHYDGNPVKVYKE